MHNKPAIETLKNEARLAILELPPENREKIRGLMEPFIQLLEENERLEDEALKNAIREGLHTPTIGYEDGMKWLDSGYQSIEGIR